MIKNNKKKTRKLFTTIINSRYCLLIIYLFVSNLSKIIYLKVVTIIDVENDYIHYKTNNDEELGRELFRRPYVGDKKILFQILFHL